MHMHMHRQRTCLSRAACNWRISTELHGRKVLDLPRETQLSPVPYVYAPPPPLISHNLSPETYEDQVGKALQVALHQLLQGILLHTDLQLLLFAAAACKALPARP